MNKPGQEKLLRCYPVLQQLPPDLFKRVEQEARLVRAPAGLELFHEGTPCSAFPMLIEGTIRATKSGPDGHEILLYRLDPGETCVITVVALLGETPYPARGQAEIDLTFFAVPRNLFMELVLKAPSFRTFVFEFLSRRMAHLMKLIDDVAFRRVDQRLASHLLLHREPISTTHQMLADTLGTTREVVSRILESFQESGMLRLGRKRIEILNRNALERVHRAPAS
jgi:CRP/FNR family transcriptional regulator, anaerobic regulatory protein